MTPKLGRKHVYYPEFGLIQIISSVISHRQQENRPTDGLTKWLRGRKVKPGETDDKWRGASGASTKRKKEGQEYTRKSCDLCSPSVYISLNSLLCSCAYGDTKCPPADARIYAEAMHVRTYVCSQPRGAAKNQHLPMSNKLLLVSKLTEWVSEWVALFCFICLLEKVWLGVNAALCGEREMEHFVFLMRFCSAAVPATMEEQGQQQEEERKRGVKEECWWKLVRAERRHGLPAVSAVRVWRGERRFDVWWLPLFEEKRFAGAEVLLLLESLFNIMWIKFSLSLLLRKLSRHWKLKSRKSSFPTKPFHITSACEYVHLCGAYPFHPMTHQ